MKKEKREKKPKSLARKIIEWTLLGVFGVLFAFVMAGQIEGMINRDKNFGQLLRFGWGSFVVQTDSMEPDLPKGSAIITYKADADEIYKQYLEYGIFDAWMNDTQSEKHIDITFQNYYIGPVKPSKTSVNDQVSTQYVFTHRLVEVQVDETKVKGQGRYTFICQGINDQGLAAKKNQFQAFNEDQILGVVQFKSNFIGWVFSALASPFGLLIFLLIPGGYLAVVSVLDIFKAMKEPEPQGPTPGVIKEENEDGTPTSASNNDDILAGLSEQDKERLKKELLEKMLEEKRKGK